MPFQLLLLIIIPIILHLLLLHPLSSSSSQEVYNYSLIHLLTQSGMIMQSSFFIVLSFITWPFSSSGITKSNECSAYTTYFLLSFQCFLRSLHLLLLLLFLFILVVSWADGDRILLWLGEVLLDRLLFLPALGQHPVEKVYLRRSKEEGVNIIFCCNWHHNHCYYDYTVNLA